MSREVEVFDGTFRVLAWLPGEDRPDEWVTASAVAEQVHELHGERQARDVTKQLAILRRASFAISREDRAGVIHWRRTPSGTAAMKQHTGDPTP